MWRKVLRGQAERQHGVIGLETITGSGGTRAQLRRELEGPSWQLISRGVWRSVGSVDTMHQRTMAGVLAAGAGASLSHSSAAWLWEMPGFRASPVHVVRVRGTNSATPPGVHVHRMRAVPANLVTELESIPVVRPELLMVQLAGRYRHQPDRLGRLLDHLWSRRLLSGASVAAALQQLAKRGRPGIPALRELLRERGQSWVPPASGLESRVLELLAANGMTSFERQVDLGGTTWTGRVDFVDRLRRVVIEVQSERFHAALSNRIDDQLRCERLETDGFSVVEVWEADVWHRPGVWLDEVRCALRASPTSRRPHP